MLSPCAAVAIVGLLVGTALAAPTPTETYKNSANLDTNGKFKLYWKIEGSIITFETHVETTGWVGFGLSPTGGMAGADLVIGWVANGNTFFKDRYATGFSMPLVDDKQDWSLILGKEEAGFTVLKFKRQLATMDCKNDITITPDTLRLIWSYNPSDPTNENQIAMHTVRGSKSLNLIDPLVDKSATLPANLLTYKFLNPAVKVPTATTTYWCHVFKMPALTKVHHIVKFEPVIQPSTAVNVHHMIGYACYNPMNASYVGLSAPCFTGQLPMDVVNCRHAIMIWAAGGDPFYFPDTVGFPLGGAGDPLYLVLETHFDNPQQRNDIVDNSGMMMSYTPDLRPVEAGVMQVGYTVAPYMFVPPKAKDFQISGVCNDECTKQALPASGINVFASALHTHMIGRKVRVRQFRNQREIADIGRDENFDSNYQQTQPLALPRKVLPGDTLVTECVYDATNVNQVTFGGLSTREEMCMAFLFYYPKTDISACHSAILPDKSITLVRSNTTGISLDYPRPNTTFWMDIMQQTKWDANLIQGLQAMQTRSDIITACIATNSSGYSSSYYVSFKTYPFPSYVTALKDNRDPCNSAAVPFPAAGFAAALLLLCLRNL